MDYPFPREVTDRLIGLALEEDIGQGDITSRSIFSEDDRSVGHILSRQEGILCGLPLLQGVYSILDSRVSVFPLMEEGSTLAPGNRVARVEGPTIAVLEGERTALNFLQRMCGIATMTSETLEILEDTGIELLDTRKTLPGFRYLDKYAVRMGGGTSHRMGLHDMVMIKENHIAAAGSIREAVRRVREKLGEEFQVEVEVTSDEEAWEASRSGADILLLDNMDRETIIRTLDRISGNVKTELSGNMTPEKIRSLRDLPVHYISMGSLTHSVKAFDLSMLFQ
jgi:nicotinate-nucleotide pyrophosphorylase (carboxylating)